MTESLFDRLRRTALDPAETTASREAAIIGLANVGTREAAEILLELGGRSDDLASILRAAGRALATLHETGVPVSEWDIRDLTLPAAEAFLE
jgi:hypothetical protein